MKISVTALFICLLLTGCLKDHTRYKISDSQKLAGDSAASGQFPLFIDGGTKVVYQFSKMTPRGLKFFLDTLDYSADSFLLPDSVKPTYLFPLVISETERNAVPGIMAISLPGFWEETIFGIFDNTWRLKLNYRNKEIIFSPTIPPVFKPGEWSGVFRCESADVKINAVLNDTKIGDHLAGKGNLQLWE